MPEIVFPSAWLKAGVNVNQGDNIRFLDEGEQDKNDNWVFLVGIVPDGKNEITEQKKFQINKKNFDAVAKIYGTNSDNWVGKEMKVRVVKVMNPRTDEMVKAVRLIAPGGMVASDVDDLPEDEA